MRIGRHDLVAIAKATVKQFREDDLSGEAAEVAYHLLFSIVPLMIFLAALTGYVSAWFGVDDTIDEVTTWLQENLPDETAVAVIDPIETLLQTQAGGILSFGALVALWGGKNAMSALIKGLNVAFDAAEARPWWRRQVLAIGLIVGLGLSLVGASAVLVYGALAGDRLARLVGLGDAWAATWSVLQFPLVIVLLMVGLAFLYWAGPNVDLPFRWVTPGSVLAVLAWIVATFGLSVYFARFAGYTAYGALGAVLAFVFWLYVMSLILLVGGELNAVVARLEAAAQEETERPTAATPEQRTAGSPFPPSATGGRGLGG
jgi:membrane protein